jgi:hypothetical protein
LYGFYHQSKLTAASKLAAANREYERKQSLIAQAKAEFSKKNSPASAKTQGGDCTFNPTWRSTAPYVSGMEFRMSLELSGHDWTGQGGVLSHEKLLTISNSH